MKNQILSLAIVLLSFPQLAFAGVLFNSIGQNRSGRGMNNYSNSQTDAARRIGSGLAQSRTPVLLEGSYHGANYYNYKVALENYRKSVQRLADAQTVSSTGRIQHVSYGVGPCQSSMPGWCEQEMANRAGGYRTVSYRNQPSVVTATPATYVRRTPIAKTPAPAVTTQQIQPARQEGIFARRQAPTMLVTPKAEEPAPTKAELTFLADPSNTEPPAQSEKGKESIWGHFQRALVGN